MAQYFDLPHGSSSLPPPQYIPQQQWADSTAYMSPSDMSVSSSPELSHLQGCWSYPASESSGFDVSVIESPLIDHYDAHYQDVFTPEVKQNTSAYFDPNWSWDAQNFSQSIPSPTHRYKTEMSSSYPLDTPFQTPANSPATTPAQFNDDVAFAGLPEVLSGNPSPTISRASSGSSSSGKEKPVCFEHGCNGRLFSSWSNLRRHQRERSRQTPQCYCPRCGAHFSRTTARKQHIANASCTRIRRYSNGRIRPSTLKLLESLMDQK